LQEDCDSCKTLDSRRGNFKRVREYVGAILSGSSGFETETKIVTYSIFTFALLILLLSLTYFFYPHLLDGPHLAIGFLTIVMSISIIASFFHLSGYLENLSCTNGMMIGMTSGMIAGLFTGALIGATNGMFIGSVFGSLAGMFIGIHLGKHCGVMGALEGLMAGLMSGTMGAMISLMMLNDNVVPFLFILAAIGIFTLGGLSYMMHREAGRQKGPGIRFLKFVFYCTLLILILGTAMMYLPKGPITI